ncbi:MAG TPA: hypothetical protein VLB87_04180 [Pyrinomonadaceae bacterium]|nr:hypothetical protein [Pyrinomonadaceae bacterium]
MRLCQFITFCVLLGMAVGVRAQSPPPGVTVKLSLADNKTVYKIGEPIKVVMEFTSDRDGYIVEYLPDDKERGSDEVVISPETGVTRWLIELIGTRGLGRDYFATDKLTSTPKRVEFFLNDTVRFDTPGRYTVSVKTGRVWQASRLTGETKTYLASTNSISFEVQAMTEAEEEKELKRLIELLGTARDGRGLEEIGRQLSYLTGDASSREKVKRSLSGETRGNFNAHMWYGLFIAQNRSLVLKLVETAMRDPKMPVTTQLLHVATTLKILLTHAASDKSDVGPGVLLNSGDPRATEIRDAYVVELAAGLGKRSGNSQTTTATTILSALPKDLQAASAGLSEIRRILIQQFDNLPPISQESLLQYQWEQVRDPALIPSLKKMLSSAGPYSKHVHEAALKRLIELAPEEVRPYVIAEIRDPGSLVDPEILGQLKDESLPEIDTSVLEQVRMLAESTQQGSSVFLKVKAALLVRYATGNIYGSVLELYQSRGTKLSQDSRAGLLAYLVKHNEREAIPLLEEAISEYNSRQSPWILSDLTKLYYSESIGTLLKKLLETDVAAHASHAAYLIGREGSAGDEQVLEARLKRWRQEWGGRIPEADAALQGQIERELIWALTNGKGWKLPAERVKELKESCLSKMCKDSNPQ